MGRIIRAQRRGAKGGCFNTNVTHRKGPTKLRKNDFAERNGYVKGVIKSIEHDSGRGAPVLVMQFRNAYHNQRDEEVMIAPEGVYSGQFLYMGKKAQLAVGNVLPIGQMPEGTIVCQMERYAGDRGKIAKASGEYVTIIGHNEDQDDQGADAVRVQEERVLRLPGNGGLGGGGGAHGQARAEGGAEPPQVQGKGERVAAGAGRVHERGGPPPRGG